MIGFSGEASQSISRREKDKIIDDVLENTADEEERRWPRDVKETGEYKAIRYRIKNWSEIKQEIL